MKILNLLSILKIITHCLTFICSSRKIQTMDNYLLIYFAKKPIQITIWNLTAATQCQQTGCSYCINWQGLCSVQWRKSTNRGSENPRHLVKKWLPQKVHQLNNSKTTTKFRGKRSKQLQVCLGSVHQGHHWKNQQDFEKIWHQIG